MRGVMSRDRFVMIKRVFSCANPTAPDNNADRLAKVRPLIDLAHTVFHKYYVPSRNVGLDESQLLCCGRNARCAHRDSHVMKKPLSDFVKSFGLHETGT